MTGSGRSAPSCGMVVVSAAVLLLGARTVRAQDAGAPKVSPTPDAKPTPSAAAPAAEAPSVPIVEVLTPKPVEPKPDATTGGQKTQFVADPVGDGAILSLSIGVVGVLSFIESTGEIRPQQPAPNARVLSIDRLAIDQTPSKVMGTYSNVGLFAAGGFALLDPVLQARRDGIMSGFVDAVLYAESVAITSGLTDITKLAIRRPRPSAYAEQARLDKAYAATPENRPDITDTDSSLSFFSGHTSVVATIGATASYLAFARAPKGSARPWITFGAFTALTGFVGYARVRTGKHFPTDVIAGAMAGIGVGLLVPHLHRSDSAKQRPVWIGYTPAAPGPNGTGGGVLTAASVW